VVQNLAYALIQVVHNFGAAAVVGLSVSGLWLRERPIARRLVLLLAVAWAVQAVTGALFGATSYHFYGHFPDIHGIAVDALFIKVGCAVAGFLLAGFACLWWECAQRHAFPIWLMLCLLASVALSSAAFLRWFS
jgi:hypothetical protein